MEVFYIHNLSPLFVCVCGLSGDVLGAATLSGIVMDLDDVAS